MVNINGDDWDIIFVEPDDPILLTGYNEYTLGVTVGAWHKIFIANNIYGDELHHVLAHELFHAEMISRGVYVPIYIEEALCDLIADYSLETLDIANYVMSNMINVF